MTPANNFGLTFAKWARALEPHQSGAERKGAQ